MERKKILWLVSWYPNKTDRFDGDFIQRHARAAAIHHDIHVILVKGIVGQETQTEECSSGCGLTEQIIYFPKRISKVGKLFNFLTWRKLYLKAVADYERKTGEPDWVHVHVPWKAGLIALELKKRKRWEYFITEHWTMFIEKKGKVFDKMPFLKKKVFQLVFQNATIVFPVSKDLGRALKSKLKINAFEHLPNVVDTEIFHLDPLQKNVRFRFIHISNFSVQKNVEPLIRSFINIQAEYPGAELVLIGPFPNAYLKYAGPQISFLGELSNIEVAIHLKQAHCLLLNSHHENAPCVISEALCCGVPVIATNVGGVPEMIDNRNGILVIPGKQKEFERALKKMITDYEKFDQIGIECRAKSIYGQEQVARRFKDIYDKAGVFNRVPTRITNP